LAALHTDGCHPFTPAQDQVNVVVLVVTALAIHKAHNPADGAIEYDHPFDHPQVPSTILCA